MGEKINITITKQTPSQKNSKNIFRNRKTGAPFITSNDRVKQWQKHAVRELESVPVRFSGKVRITYHFYVEDNAQRDLDNMIASVNDVLQVANAAKVLRNGKLKTVKGTGMIKGDNWQLLTIGGADAEIDRVNPRAELVIEDLDFKEN